MWSNEMEKCLPALNVYREMVMTRENLESLEQSWIIHRSEVITLPLV